MMTAQGTLMKKRIYNIFAMTSISIMALTGCQKVKTAQYYVEHPDDRQAVLKQCAEESKQGNKVEGKLAENCQNARAAVRMTIFNMVHTAP